MLGHRVNSEGLRGRANAPRRRRTQEVLYRVCSRFLSTFPSTKKRKKAAIFAGFCHPRPGISAMAPRRPAAMRKAMDHRRFRHLSARHAVLRPHSSADPWVIERVSRIRGEATAFHKLFKSLPSRGPGPPVPEHGNGCKTGARRRRHLRLALLGEVARRESLLKGNVARGHLARRELKGDFRTGVLQPKSGAAEGEPWSGAWSGEWSWTNRGCAAQNIIVAWPPRQSISATSRRFRSTAAPAAWSIAAASRCNGLAERS